MKVRHFVGGAWLFWSLRLIIISVEMKTAEGVGLAFLGSLLGGIAVAMLMWNHDKPACQDEKSGGGGGGGSIVKVIAVGAGK